MNIHITKEEKEALKSLVSGGYAAADNLKAVADAISVITESLELHSSDLPYTSQMYRIRF